MACNSIQLANIARDCEANVGGIKKVWLTNYADDMFQLDTYWFLNYRCDKW